MQRGWGGGPKRKEHRRPMRPMEAMGAAAPNRPPLQAAGPEIGSAHRELNRHVEQHPRGPQQP